MIMKTMEIGFGKLSMILVEWKPSLYQLIKSEIRKECKSKLRLYLLAKSFWLTIITVQAAWLNEDIKIKTRLILDVEMIDFVFGNLSEELYPRLKNNNTLDEFVKCF